MIAVRCEPELLAYIETLPEDMRLEIVKAMCSLSNETQVGKAESLAEYGMEGAYRFAVGDYQLLFRFPLPPAQPGGFQMLWFFGIIEPTHRLDEENFFKKLGESVLTPLKRAVSQK